MQLLILQLRFPIPQLVALLLHWFLQFIVGFVVAFVVTYSGLYMTIISLILWYYLYYNCCNKFCWWKNYNWCGILNWLCMCRHLVYILYCQTSSVTCSSIWITIYSPITSSIVFFPFNFVGASNWTFGTSPLGPTSYWLKSNGWKHNKVEYVILPQFVGLSIMGHGTKI